MPASHAYPPYIEGIIFDATGKPAAGGTVEAYVAGSSVPAALWSTSDPATSLGPVVTIDGAGRAAFRLREGYAYKLRAKDKDGALIWERDNVKCPLDGGGVNIPNPMESTGDMIVGGVGGQPERLAPGNDGEVLKVVSGVPTWAPDAVGMQNPMTDPGDLIVGTTDGEPSRLGVGNDGDILATANGSPTWEAGPKKYRAVYGDIPSPQIDDGYLGCLFYLSTAGQTLTLPATATIPAKSFIDFVCINDAATLTITPDGTTTLNEQATAVTIGGKSATLYRLTFLGHGGSGDEWALGGSVLPDGKIKVDGSDTSPDYLAAKLAAGTGISLTNTGSAVEIAADAQTGDHQLLVSATDAAAGYLAAKLTAGSNVTLTPQTDGDGVQTLEISATGGGGGGGGSFYDYVFGYNCMPSTTRAPSGGYTLYFSYIAMRDGSPSGIFVPEAVPQTWTNIKCTIAIYEYKNLENASCAQLEFGNATITSTASDRILRIPFTTTQNISAGTRVWVALCFSSYVDFNYRTISASGTYYCKYKQYTPTAGDTFNANGTSDISNVPICGLYYDS